MAVYSRTDRRPHEAEKHNEKLLAILIPYEIRKSVLQYLSAYDVAKLDEYLGHVLDPRERSIYLDPMRDLFWDVADIQTLLRAGMEFILLGNDTSALVQRLHDTKKYSRKYSKRKLHVFLVGFFPFQGQDSYTLERLMAFSVNRAPSNIRLFTDKYHLKRMRASHDLNAIRRFIIAFGALTMSPKGSNAGFWHKVPSILDATVELRVYVPSYDDRVREEVTISRWEVLQLHRCVFRNSVYDIVNLLKVCVGYPVMKLHWKHAEDQERRRETIEKVNSGVFRLFCHRAFATAV
jgi:hypothetical protein